MARPVGEPRASGAQRVDSRTAVPLTDSTLSLLEPNGRRCEWRRLDVGGKKSAVMASFDGTCAGAVVAFSHDQTKALVRFDPDLVYTPGYSARGAAKPKHASESVDAGAQHRIYEVTLATGRVETIAPPPLNDDPHTIGYALTIGYAPNGDLLSLAVESLDERAQKENKAVVDGVELTWEPGSEGIRAVAHARRFERGTWRRIETKATTTGWDYAANERALDAAETLGPITSDLLEGRNGADPADATAEKMLRPHRPADEGEFARLDVGGVAVYFWQVTGEFAYSTGLVVSADGSRLETGFSSGEIVALVPQPPYLLVTASGVGAFPRVIDLRTRQVVFASETARATIFWPRPRK